MFFRCQVSTYWQLWGVCSTVCSVSSAGQLTTCTAYTQTFPVLTAGVVCACACAVVYVCPQPGHKLQEYTMHESSVLKGISKVYGAKKAAALALLAQEDKAAVGGGGKQRSKK